MRLYELYFLLINERGAIRLSIGESHHKNGWTFISRPMHLDRFIFDQVHLCNRRGCLVMNASKSELEYGKTIAIHVSDEEFGELKWL